MPHLPKGEHTVDVEIDPSTDASTTLFSVSEHPVTERRTGLLPRYEFERLIGQGAFGSVYLATDRELHRRVAVKIAVNSSPQLRRSFLSEGRSLAALDHPNIVPVYDCGSLDDGTIFLVSKFIRNGCLSHYRKTRSLSVTDKLTIIRDVALGLQHAHEKMILHRDLKPSNVFVDDNNRAYVGDFGLAINRGSSTADRSVAGTPAYMSPEQLLANTEHLDGRSDIFSLGVILFELLTDARPFRGSSLDEVREQFFLEDPTVRLVECGIDHDLIELNSRLMAKDPADRFATAIDVAEEVDRLLARRQAACASPPASRSKVSKLVLTVGGVTLAILATLFALQADTDAQNQNGVAEQSRAVAARVIELGGALDTENRVPPQINTEAELPEQDFSVLSINLYDCDSVQPDDIARLASLPDLKHLHVASVGLTNGDLLSISKLSALESLWINYNPLDDDGGIHLEALKRLTKLNLGWTNVSDKTVKAIATLDQLEELDLSNTSITNCSIKSLAGLSQLRSLSLHSTVIDDKAIPWLSKLQCVTSMDLTETNLSKEGIARLRQSLSQCRIKSDDDAEL